MVRFVSLSLILLSLCNVKGFVPSTPLSSTMTAPSSFPSSSRTTTLPRQVSSSQLAAFPFLSEPAVAAAPDNPLLTYFLQVCISNGVPAVFTIIVIGFAAWQFRPKKDSKNNMMFNNMNNPAALLYDDLYGDQEQDPFKNQGGDGPDFFSMFNPNKQQKTPKNLGIPKQQYFKVTHLNQKYDAYKYTLQSAVSSKAAAASTYRQSALQTALRRALPADISLSTWKNLQKAEQEFLKDASELSAQVEGYQSALIKNAIEDELKNGMGIENVQEVLTTMDAVIETNATESKSSSSIQKSTPKKKRFSEKETLTALAKVQTELQECELEFIQAVTNAVGPSHAASLQAAILGNTGGLSLFNLLNERPLTTMLKSDDGQKHRLFVTNFPGDASASQVKELREEVTAILSVAKPGDQALITLQTGGGTVTGYGLAAAQLLRLKQAGLFVTICVEQVAASGGYMMACIADRIIASPFAVLGSIGVITDIPNFYDRLKQEGIEFQTVTAGKFKRTLTPTKKPTKEDFEKTKADVEEILVLFREFVRQNRPQLDIDKVATGETWFGTAALERNLCDEIRTVDDVLTDYVHNKQFDVYEIKYKPPAQETPFGKLLPATSASSLSSSSSLLEEPIRWLVRSVTNAVKEELGEIASSAQNVPLEKRYMAKDDTANRVKSQD